MKRKVYFVSDHTGLTVEAIGRALLSQFPDFEFQTHLVPFVDDIAKVRELVGRIATEEPPPLVFSSLVDGELRAVLSGSGVPSFDFFETYTTPLEQVLGIHSAPRLGKHHGIGDPGSYQNRMHAVHFAVDNDDGAVTRHYGESDLILVGVSRSGKTPTCLYLGLQYGVRAANYPLTDDDFERDNAGEELPQALRPYRDKLFGLRIEPAQLQRIRSERRPDSRYASLEQCQREIAFSDALFRRFAVPVLDVTAMSIEEIAARLVQRLRKPQM